MSREAKKLLLQRSNQSFLTEPESTLQDRLTSVLIESNQLCFKLSPGDFIEKYFQSKAGSNVHFRLDLFTDPYNAHLNYSGHKLNPITYEWLNQSALPNLWDLRNGIRDSMPDSGYSLIIVERGRMPSMFQRQLHMAPGRAYYISLSMEQVEFSKELHHVRCLPGENTWAFVDSLTGTKIVYNNSYYACLYHKYAHNFHSSKNYVSDSFPIPWELRNSLKKHNLTESHLINGSAWDRWGDNYFALITGNESQVCELLKPCVNRKYTAERLSFNNWPTFSGSFAQPLKEIVGSGRKPALQQLIHMAEQLDSGNHSTHTEALFNKFLSDSMLRVYIGIESPKSPKLLISYSYSWSTFLADIGGLLGLYIGCSLLTLCELVELFYHAIGTTLKRGQRGAAESHKPDGVSQCRDEEELVAMAPEQPVLNETASNA